MEFAFYYGVILRLMIFKPMFRKENIDSYDFLIVRTAVVPAIVL